MSRTSTNVPIGFKLKVSPMEQWNNTKWGFFCGITGGMGKYLLDINDFSPFLLKMLGAGITAFMCGVLGAMGKHLYDYLKRLKFFKTIIAIIKKIFK